MAGGSKGGGPGPDSSKSASSFESAGDRLRFTVELRPEETTIVSWKKLVREANLSRSGKPDPSVSEPEILPRLVSVPPLPPVAGASVEPSAEKEQKDPQGQAGSTRLNTVIERIERMYAGSGSSDDEDVMLDNVPDDDEYDTDDSFIDDAELDDYFQVDNSAVKHHGFFVNRGKLERVEPTISSNQQPKKRRHKDLAKGKNESDDGRNPNKTAKLVNKGKNASSVFQTIPTNQPRIVGMPNIPGEDMQFQAAHVDAAEFSIKKKSSDLHATEDSSGFLGVGAIRQSMDIDEQMLENVSLKKHSIKLKETEPNDAAACRSNDKSSYPSKTHYGKQSSKVDDLDRPIEQKVKGGLLGKIDLNAPPNRESVPTTATPMPRKQGSSVRPKVTKLEKAIMELKQIVAESRPPSTEVQDPDNSSPAVKKRVPSEIRQKLLKVATLAQTSYGEIPVDVINRLMSIVGHLMQLRTLKVAVPVLSDGGHCVCVWLNVFADVSRYFAYVVPEFSMHLPTLDTFFSVFSGSLSDREKLTNKKVLPPKPKDATNVSQSSHIHEKPLSSVSRSPLTKKPVFSARKPVALAHGPKVDKRNEEMAKTSTNGNPVDAVTSNSVPKKKLKKKPNPEALDAQVRLEKLALSPTDERPKL
ncbi:Unknown protein [Striga hermonthica]|uniref:Hpc2-related domain-containing protein n=1 Tax=Striga hermonthica TaxID=68872 RepID=A0A9N7MWR2_STRHE|nr:Unknown protein [Striga hermonthica]